MNIKKILKLIPTFFVFIAGINFFTATLFKYNLVIKLLGMPYLNIVNIIYGISCLILSALILYESFFLKE